MLWRRCFLLCVRLYVSKIAPMKKEINIEKAVRQHLEMDTFFTGGFSVKKPARNLTEPQNGQADIEENVELQQQGGQRNIDAAAELEKIAAEVRRCCKCTLGGTRKNAVPGEGNPNARIVFVGEAPGADEDAQGRPFVGRAGQLLDNILKAVGLKRKDVYICNVLKCRPPDNRDPKPEEIISCMPYLQRQIEAINPEMIVALGAHAARTLLNSNEAIGRLRGYFHEYHTGIGSKPIKLMATYHPAYLLRNYSDENRRRVWEDMKKVVAELGLPLPSGGRKE